MSSHRHEDLPALINAAITGYRSDTAVLALIALSLPMSLDLKAPYIERVTRSIGNIALKLRKAAVVTRLAYGNKVVKDIVKRLTILTIVFIFALQRIPVKLTRSRRGGSSCGILHEKVSVRKHRHVGIE